MKIVYTLVFRLAIVLYSIESGLQFECLPNGAPIPYIHRGGTSPPSCSRQHNSPMRPRHPIDDSFRDRSRSPRGMPMNPPAKYIAPPTRLPSPDEKECGVEQLQLIRLSPFKHTDQIFQLQRYTFPVNKIVRMRVDDNIHTSMPVNEQIVLSSSDGHVCAILESYNTLSGIYINEKRTGHAKRVKINIESGLVIKLTREEIKDIPVGHRRPISGSFKVTLVNDV